MTPPSTASPPAAEQAAQPGAFAQTVPNAEAEALRGLQQEMMRSVARAAAQRDLLAALCQTVCPLLRPAAMFYLSRTESGDLAPERLPVTGGVVNVGDDLAAQIHEWSEAACRQGATGVHGLEGMPGLAVIAAPVVKRGRAPDAVTAVVTASKQRTESAVAILQLFAAHVTLWNVLHEGVAAESEAESAAALVELLTSVQAQDDPRQAALALASELQEFLACRRVVVGLRSRRGGPVRIAAVSGMPQFDRRTEWSRAVEAALEESLIRDALTVWPPLSQAERHAALAHQRLAEHCDHACLVSSPLRNEREEPVGAWLFIGDEKTLHGPKTLAFLRAAEAPVAGSLDLVRRAAPGPAVRLARALLGRNRGWRLKAALAAIVLLIAAGALPVTYHVRCDCETQPVVRRYVAAPFAATLAEALVRPGDIVSREQPLAQLDGRELRWELAALEAEYQAEVKKHDAALAAGNTAEAQMARLGMERIELRRRLLDHRVQNLEVRSPIAGMVISGELDRSEGAPLAVGEVLFEIAPLDRMLVEVGIPESEIAYVEQGMPVEIALDAHPGRAWQGTVEVVHPRAEAADYQTVFIAEVLLDNRPGDLRPGMHGTAWIASHRYPLAWNLFHRAWESARSALPW